MDNISEKTKNGIEVKHMWECPMPLSGVDVKGAGFPILKNVIHNKIFHATEENGGYNHHPSLTWFNGKFYAMWSNHSYGEDEPGQRVLYSTSPDGCNWDLWQELFSSPEEMKKGKGYVLTALDWVKYQGNLYALAGCHKNIGYFNPEKDDLSDIKDKNHSFLAKKGYSPFFREIKKEGNTGPVIPLENKNPSQEELKFDYLEDINEEIKEIQKGLVKVIYSPENMPSWDFEGKVNIPQGVDSNTLCEPTVYRAQDGNLVMLLRDNNHSHRMYFSISKGEGKCWPEAVPTDIPDAPSLSKTLRLKDGTILLVGNQIAPEFDNANKIRNYRRVPLTVSVSQDGYIFDSVYALQTDIHHIRLKDVGGRGPYGGAQYPDPIIHQKRLYVIYSMQKEDIGVSQVNLSDLFFKKNKKR